jgi:hypothetical protein
LIRNTSEKRTNYWITRILRNNPTKISILVLLDGEYLFEPFFGALNYGYWDDLPETIIVGISQNSQTREADCGFDPTEALPTKQASRFF